MTAPLLQIRGLAVRYSSGPVVLDGLDLDVQAGECLALVGESGCGKMVLCARCDRTCSRVMTAAEIWQSSCSRVLTTPGDDRAGAAAEGI